MKTGLVGQSYQQRSLPFDAQRTVNMYPVLDETGKETAMLLGTPGLVEFGDVTIGTSRGGFVSANGRCFFVIAGALYEIYEDGTYTSRGGLNILSGNVTMAENPTQLAICDGTYLYILTYSSNSFVEVSDADLPSSGTVTFIDGYFVVNENNSGRFFISALNDGTTWAALDYATAESEPDSLKRVINAAGQLWLLGETTSEIWTNTGASAFPFQRISGAVMQTGIMSPFTARVIGNTLVWCGKDRQGRGIVYAAQGFTPQRISNEAIEIKLQSVTNSEDLTSWVYQQDGHTFYVITGGDLETTLCYDLTTKSWHERSHFEDGNHTQHLGICHVYAFGKHLLGSRVDSKIYEMSLDYYDDAGDEIARDRIFTHLSSEDKRIRYNSLIISMETGVGLQSGQGSDPLISLRLSKDGARTWSSWYTAQFGAVGKYKTKVGFNRLGIAEQMTFHTRITDPVKVALIGGYLE